MLDTATQILSTIQSGNKSVEKSSSSQNNDRASRDVFSDVLQRSKYEDKKTQPDRRSSNDAPQESKRSLSSQQSKSVTESRSDERIQAKKTSSSKNEESNIKLDDQEESSPPESKISESSSSESDLTDEEKDQDVAKVAEIEDPSSDDEVPEDVDLVAALNEKIQADLEEESDEAELVEKPGLKVGHELHALIDDKKAFKETGEKIGHLSQKIVEDLKSVSDKKLTKELESAKDTENKSPLLTRAQVLEKIEKILDKDLLQEVTKSSPLLKADPAVATKIIGDQLKMKDLGVPIKQDIKPEVELLTESEVLPDSDDSTDSLLQKIMEKLDFNRMKGDTAYQAKMQNLAAEKIVATEVSTPSTIKASADVIAATPLTQVSGVMSRPGASTPQIQQFTMNTHINQPDWGNEFNRRINFMINNDLKHAELRLDPPELGRINIKISMNQDQASMVFTSAHGNVREAIENTLPRLRELLLESGIQLGDANVDGQQKENAKETDRDSQLAGPVFPESEEEELVESTVETESTMHSVDGVIDYFA